MTILIIALIAAVIALLFAAVRARDVLAEDEGNEAMRRIGKAIQLGAATFLRREYTFIAVFVAVVFVVLLLFIDIDLLDKFAGSNQRWTSISYLVGAILSASAGYLGMLIAVRANVRTAAKAQQGLNPALRTAFNSGTVMGMTVVGLGLLGLVIMYLIWQDYRPLAGFAFGASSIALFARVGGGIFTKAADVGADLVGKIEAGIPEDDPRNPSRTSARSSPPWPSPPALPRCSPPTSSAGRTTSSSCRCWLPRSGSSRRCSAPSWSAPVKRPIRAGCSGRCAPAFSGPPGWCCWALASQSP